MPYKVLIAAGSSGGHLLPAVSFAQALQKKTPCDVHFLLSRLKNWEIPPSLASFSVHWTGSFAFPQVLSLNSLLFPLKFILNSMRILQALLKENPDLVVGFGGYVSFPAVVLARLLGRPTLIHEQNRTFGKANRVLARFAKKVAVSFPLNGKRNVSETKFVVTGNLLRSALTQKAEKSLYVLPAKTDKLNVLLVGGSQGAKRLNLIFVEALKGLKEEELSQYRIQHVTGNLNHAEVVSLYQNIPGTLEREIIPFTNKIEELYLRSHWVIARSGAGSIFELMAFGRPSLLVPYPYAASHQLDNARFLEEKGACEVVEERDLSPEILRSYLRSLRQDPEKLKRFAENAKNSRVLNGAEALASLALSLMESRN
jgi:UDP-N-acetylglucosamine--N-acetylmuramyl-(pentapeptide) pyrophosphoryl-undecaprenol N-acetylglucosamine transferase